jgi:ATP-dependent exoDNAse (exonuclease V) beta subunit
MKYSDKYKYIQGRQITDPGSRVYEIKGSRLPSVTTILAKTKDQGYINRWKEKVGHEEAERIKNLSSKRGTAMHKFLEKHVEGIGYQDLTPVGRQAAPMAQKIIEIGLAPITEYYGSETTLYYPGLYAGSTDLICLHNDMETIVDFKQANRPKNPDWIADYYMQIAAYCMAHDQVYGSNIRQGIIMVCTPDLYFQEFRFQDHEMRKWRHEWLKRLDMYYELQRDYKEEAQIDTQALLKEFEQDA